MRSLVSLKMPEGVGNDHFDPGMYHEFYSILCNSILVPKLSQVLVLDFFTTPPGRGTSSTVYRVRSESYWNIRLCW